MGNLKRRLTCLLLVTLLLFSSATPLFAAVSYTYDASGNMLSDGINCYVYNEANQAKQVNNCGGKLIAEYIYDYTGARIAKKEYDSAGVYKDTIYSPAKEYETKKLADNSTQNSTYYYVNNELVSNKNPDASKNYYQSDQLGSATLLTNQAGSVVENTSYYPFGEVRAGGVQSKYQFTGQEKDIESGLNYYGARYYNSHIAHFTQPDTALPNIYDPQQLNRYAYTKNNPLKYVDSTGHFVQFALTLATFSAGNYLAGLEAGGAINGAIQYYATNTDNKASLTEYMFNGVQEQVHSVNGQRALGAAMLAAGMWSQEGESNEEAPATIEETAQTLGKAGESTGAIVKNTETLPSFFNLVGPRSLRIPDDIQRVNGQIVYIGESKNVAYQSLTKQLMDYVLYAQNEHIPLDLWIRPNNGTKLSGPLMDLVEKGAVRLNYLKLK